MNTPRLQVRWILSFLAMAALPLNPPSAGLADPAEKGFVSLFDGKTLKGWKKHTGVPESDVGGKWKVLDGAIAGDQDPPGRGGFLITEKKYKDILLRLETKIDWPVDSGIFLRMGEDGKSHQVTLDYRPEGEIGAIYCPWTKGFVHHTPGGIKEWKKGEWNDLKIQIRGEPAHIRVWLNAKLITDFTHTRESTAGIPAEGYIGLQIHPGGDWVEGNKARFRNLRVQELK